jgi:diaminopimelate epimerase
LKFVKMQATGNDFIVVDARGVERNWVEMAKAMCNRHFGVGADGLLLLLSSEIADFMMRIFNPDGSEAETCGNGLRCFAKYIIEERLVKIREEEIVVETLAGVKMLSPQIEDERVSGVQVSMGIPRLKLEDIPVLIDQNRGELDITLPPCYTISVAGKNLLLRLVSMGNPHAVCFVDEPISEFPLTELGPRIECHPSFPQRINFEVANIVNRGLITARVWERGVGETLSCGSGACAIAAVAQLCHDASNPVAVKLPGGTLSVEWGGGGEILLGGPVERVFTGDWPEG